MASPPLSGSSSLGQLKQSCDTTKHTVTLPPWGVRNNWLKAHPSPRVSPTAQHIPSSTFLPRGQKTSGVVRKTSWASDLGCCLFYKTGVQLPRQLPPRTNLHLQVIKSSPWTQSQRSPGPQAIFSGAQVGGLRGVCRAGPTESAESKAPRVWDHSARVGKHCFSPLMS